MVVRMVIVNIKNNKLKLNMKNKLGLSIVLVFIVGWLNAQEINKIPLPTNLEQGYPRLYVTESGKKDLEKTIKKEAWAKDVLKGIHDRIDAYVSRHVEDP